MNSAVGMHHAKTRSLLSNTIKDTSTIRRNPSLYIFRQRVTHDCASILDSIAKKTSIFRMVHHCSFSRMIFTLVICCKEVHIDEYSLAVPPATDVIIP